MRPGKYSLSLEARAPQDARLHVEICKKHLLYGESCAIDTLSVKAAGGEWRKFEIPLDAGELKGEPWYAPRLAFFSMALETSGRVIDIRDVSLLGPRGAAVIVNGDFGNGMSRWFFTSDRYHLPWHIKNLALNVLFDQGVVGLALFSALVAIALWRLVAGRASAHPLAPYLASALAGFLVVGAFDSLLDAPRAAFLFYLLLTSGLALRAPLAMATGKGAAPRPIQSGHAI
jgi:hypothetical protein